jgi:hypothetical protein
MMLIAAVPGICAALRIFAATSPQGTVLPEFMGY